MPASSRFAVALHVVTLLAAEGGRPVPSALVAGSIRTNPVVIRRILRDLSRAGIVHTRRGSSGGSSLSRAPGRVTLLQVYRAVGECEALSLPGRTGNPRCPVGACMGRVAAAVLRRAQRALERELSRATVADLARAVGR